MVWYCAVNDNMGRILFPPPFSAHWIGVMPPAKHTFVRTSQRGSCFHASVTLNTVESVLVAATSAPQHRFRPSAQLDTRVRAYQLVSLLAQSFPQFWGNHLNRLFVFLSGTFNDRRRVVFVNFVTILSNKIAHFFNIDQ